VKYIVLILAVFVVGCGSGTVGPLITNGLDARLDLQRSVRGWQRHGNADSTPLDAMLVLDHNDALPSGVLTKGWIVSEEGTMLNPVMSVVDRPLVSRGNGSCMRLIHVTSPLLPVKITWPDTTVAFTDSVLTEDDVAADTVIRTAEWSIAAPVAIRTDGPRADSIVLDVASFSDSTANGDTTVVIADTGAFTLPPSILATIRPGDQVLVFLSRSHYRTRRIPTPTSGYGDRVVGILQRRHTVNYRVFIVP
jgi:hypothetical protein